MEINCNNLVVLALICLVCCWVQPTSAAATASPNIPPAYTKFIKSRCSKTTYPTPCIKTLSPYASFIKTNPYRLCATALNIAIQGANQASTSISYLASQKGYSRTEAAVLKDCKDDVKDANGELKQAFSALGHFKDADGEFQWATSKTHASASISDLESCLDGFTERKFNPALRTKMTSYVRPLEQRISIALALINHYY